MYYVAVNVTYIAFSAHRSDTEQVEPGERIIYNSVRMNVGGAYDAGNGVFTCPINGYYFFSITSFSLVSRYNCLSIDSNLMRYTFC